MTITRNDLAMFFAFLGGAWFGSVRYEHGGAAVSYAVFGIAAAVAAFAIKRDA